MARPLRASGVFGRGGWLDAASFSAKLALVLVAGSVAVRLSDTLADLLLLHPAGVIGRLQLWQLLSYGLALPISPNSALAFIFSIIIIWSIGGQMELSWSAKRLLWFLGGTLLASSVLTVLLGFVWPTVRMLPYFGGEVITLALWAGYGFSMGSRQTGFWGLPVTGNVLALIGLAFSLIQAISVRTLAVVVHELFAFGITFLYVRYGSPRVLVLRLRQWKMQRDLKSRAKHLNVISGGDRGRGSDRFLH